MNPNAMMERPRPAVASSLFKIFMSAWWLIPLLAVLLLNNAESDWSIYQGAIRLSSRWLPNYQTFMMPGSTRKSYFQTIQKFKADYAPATFTHYKSDRTGMNVVAIDQEGPKVHGFFALATEIFDDSGAPHTLEHLVFMGSKTYKYKGVLDKLANRAYSSTNAWTATDHTAYTLDTAGWEGFAQILPVYLEHVILPTLTDEGCYTEVHHVDGEGHDAGVVYSEMQGVQNTGAELMDLEARRLLYPENIGYRYETGGMMEQLRVLTADRIRAFHKEMYQPKNLCLVIVGEIDHENMFEILDEFEGGILDDIPRPDAPFKRPWIESPQVPPLKQSIIKTVEFPEEDETAGDILVGFIGPDYNDKVQVAALVVILTYLSGSSVAVLERIMVEEEELASSISAWWDPRAPLVIWLQPTSVATERLAEVEKRLVEILHDVASKPLDMSYITDCINRERRQIKFRAESSALYFVTNAINDFLFGKRDGSTLKELGKIQEYDILEGWTEQQWRDFLKTWISDANHVSILGKPSKAMAEKLEADEVARVAAQIEKFGPEGLKELAEELENAKSTNDAPIPKEVLEKWPVPGVSSIHFIESTTARSGLARHLGVSDNKIQKIIDSNEDQPLFIQFEHIETNFVHLTVFIGNSDIPVELQPLLSLFLQNFFTTPIMRDGVKVDFQEVVIELEKDTVSYSISGGSQISDAEGVVIQFQIEPDKYEKSVHWIRTMMFDSVFDEKRLYPALNKMLADIPEAKRSGSSMLNAVDAMIHLAPESVAKARNTLVKAIYLKRLKKLLDKDPAKVISMLEVVRKSLFTFNNFRVLVIADVEKLPAPVQAWDILIKGLDTSKPLLPIVLQHQTLSPAGYNPGTIGAVIVPMPTIDSSFSMSTAKGPTSYTDPQMPALMVATAYLDAVEGPLWSAVRGTGLAYGTGFSRELDSGCLQFRVYRSPDAYKAFAASKAIIESFVEGKTGFEDHALEGAISSIVVVMADEQPTMATAAQLSFVNSVIRNLSRDFNAELLRKVRQVSVDDIRKAMQDALLPAFSPGTSNVVITCAPIMEDTIVKGFASEGFKTQVQPLAHFQEDYGLEADGDDAEDDDDDDEEDDYEQHGDDDDVDDDGEEDP